jgi:pyruvate/2-oxoglutarate dehydrogenase complex dihydrolipoamide acyltransferase (E2) component
MSQVEEKRHEMNVHEYPDSETHHVTATAFLLKAISLAQKEFPESRSYFLPYGTLVTYENIVAGFTIEREVKGQPVVFFGEIERPCEKSILEIADELRACSSAELMSVKKLREQVRFAEMPWLLRWFILLLGAWFPACRLLCMKATFGLSSLGSLGVSTAFGPSVCTSVFGVGAVQKRAVVVDDQIVIKSMLSLALSYDQRAMDGGQAARFLNKVRSIIESGSIR